MIFAGKLCVWCFLLGCSSSVIYWLVVALFGGHEALSGSNEYSLYVFLVGHFVAINLVTRALLKDFEYQVANRACMLGTLFSCGLFVAFLSPPTYALFGWYMCVLTFFHFSEFVAISGCNPETLAISSFVLDHSLDYKIAAVTSWTEFFLERYFFPEMKTVRVIPTLGLAWCIGGELLRKVAMLTASRSFTHVVVSKKVDHHVLITKGVYSWFRHPSYVGWFYWAVGTQLVLANPICTVAYLLASWKFFNDRITIEELTLLNFFGEDYIRYQKNVPIGLPFIKGYVLEE
ncbi:protein-S-isoprenylcysteine O-methyltransferase [Nesidiocoris tenuis]|uniref:Protein-S-isoprenylcysteine O-methyltransferase n=1 Tax=Nesidiocoris tenuis TaxID=355587 RepID=A0ABN7AR47_9HEMI|nr:protein-S-isoprenylcysteine O-methyltransferase [Nesidiocoris tenuis]